MKSIPIREALAALNTSSAEFARDLSKLRRDGKVTSAATVSKWINGRVQLPLGICIWLKDRLVRHALSLSPRLGGIKVITVGGGKGGSGTSPISAFLAAAAQARGYRVRLGASQYSLEGLHLWAKDLIEPFGKLMLINLEELKFIKDELNGKVDLLIIDIGNKTMLTEADLKKIDLKSIDLSILPFNPSSQLHFHPAELAARALLANGVDQFMLLPMMDRMSLALMLRRSTHHVSTSGLGAHLSDVAIFKRHSVQPPKSPYDPASEIFQDADLAREYESLLDEVLCRSGVNLDLVQMSEEELRLLEIDELISVIHARRGIGERSIDLKLESFWLQKPFPRNGPDRPARPR